MNPVDVELTRGLVRRADPRVVRAGMLAIQVCVPSEWTDEMVLKFAELNNPCGTEAGWSIRREGDPLLAGAPERAKCADRDGFVHLVLDA